MSEQNKVTRTAVPDAAPAENGSSTTDASAHAAPPPPQLDQQEVWRRDLYYKKISLIVSVCGFLLVLGGLLLNAYQAQKTAKSVRLSLDAAVVARVTELDQVFMRRPQMIPYFFEGKAITEAEEDYPEASATALMVLDVFDLLVGQSKRYREYWQTPDLWDAYMIDVFGTSPLLRDTLKKYSGWYGPELKTLCKNGRDKSGAKDSPCE